jgi:hypothetical protein
LSRSTIIDFAHKTQQNQGRLLCEPVCQSGEIKICSCVTVNKSLKSSFGKGQFNPYLRRSSAPHVSRETTQSVISRVKNLSDSQIVDEEFLAQRFIPELGLNDEILSEQPPEFSAHFGTGIYLWQYPNQLAALLVHLARTQPASTRYMEIGSRWGGTFLLMSLWLSRVSSRRFEQATALDVIEAPPLIQSLTDLEAELGFKVVYLRMDSHDERVESYVANSRPDTVLIDGEHSVQAALHDHMLFEAVSDRIIHHDIASDALPHLAFFYESIATLGADRWSSKVFDHQYESVTGSFLGIGLLERKSA